MAAKTIAIRCWRGELLHPTAISGTSRVASAQYNDQLGPAALGLGATSSALRRFGCGAAQEIDTAAMTVYMKYQRYDADVTGLSAAVGHLDSADFVSAGVLLNF